MTQKTPRSRSSWAMPQQNSPLSMRRRVLFAGTLAAAGLLTSPAVQALQGGKLKVGLVLKSLADPFTAAMQNAAQNYQQHYASQFGLTVRGTASEGDTAVQIRMVEDMIRAKMDAIVIAPTDSKALTPVIARGIKAGIIVITIDNPLDDVSQDAAGISVPFVGPNNRKGALQVAKVLAGRLKAGDEVGIIEGIRPIAMPSSARKEAGRR